MIRWLPTVFEIVLLLFEKTNRFVKRFLVKKKNAVTTWSIGAEFRS